MTYEQDTSPLRRPSMHLRRLTLASLAVLPCTLLKAQGVCSSAGMTLTEALAAWQDTQKRMQMDKEAYAVVLQRQSLGLFKGMKDGAEKEEMGILGELRKH